MVISIGDIKLIIGSGYSGWLIKLCVLECAIFKSCCAAARQCFDLASMRIKSFDAIVKGKIVVLLLVQSVMAYGRASLSPQIRRSFGEVAASLPLAQFLLRDD